MKKTFFTFALLFWAVASCYAQNFDSNELRKLPSFSKIKAGGVFEVVLIQGNDESAKVSVKNIPLKDIVTEVRAGELCLELAKNNYNDIQVRVEITFKQLTGIKLAGACSLRADNSLKFNDFQIKIAGAGKIDIAAIEANKLECDAAGASNINLKGKVNTQILNLSGAGEYRASELACNDTKVSIAGAGKATVVAQNSLTGKLMGAASLRYKGAPKTKDIVSTGASSAQSME